MGIKINNKHSSDDWGLIMTDFKISAPEPKLKLLDIPGVDGHLDMTEQLTGYIPYYNRTIVCQFVCPTNTIDWHVLYSTISNFCHGKKCQLIFDADPTHYYYGRVSVDTDRMDQVHSIFTLQAEVEPYKYELYSSIDDWYWDTFNFETDMAREYGDIKVDGEHHLRVIGSNNTFHPIVTVSADMELFVDGQKFELQSGTTKLYEVVIQNQEYDFIFKGKGVVSVEIRGGSF